MEIDLGKEKSKGKKDKEKELKEKKKNGKEKKREKRNRRNGAYDRKWGIKGEKGKQRVKAALKQLWKGNYNCTTVLTESMKIFMVLHHMPCLISGNPNPPLSSVLCCFCM